MSKNNLTESQKIALSDSKIFLIQDLFKNIRLIDNNWFDESDVKQIAKSIKLIANSYEKIAFKEISKFNKNKKKE